MSNVEGKIAAILSPVKVVINRGSKDGVEQGDYFVIYSELGPFPDPDNPHEDLGPYKQIWGRVKVSIVEHRFCVGETETRIRSPFEGTALAALFGTTVQQIKLPVNEGQIWKGVERIEIGFPARLVKPVSETEEEDDETEQLPSAQPSLLGPASYRKEKGQYTWHSCSNCSTWPTSNYVTVAGTPTSGELCNECKAKMAANICR